MQGDINYQLIVAAGEFGIPAIGELLIAGADINYAVDYRGTPLSYAVSKGKIDNARFLIERGADINKPDPTIGSSPLEVAVLAGNADMAKLLVDRGANPLVKNNRGFTPLHTAIYPAFKPELYAVLVARRPDTLGESSTMAEYGLNEQLSTPTIARIIDHGDREEFRARAISALRREIDEIPDTVPERRQEVVSILTRLQAGEMQGGKRRRRRGRGRKTVKARKAMKRKRKTMRRR
jgi:hypothetical protein